MGQAGGLAAETDPIESTKRQLTAMCRPCPFCRSRGLHIAERNIVSPEAIQSFFFVVCGNCGATGPRRANPIWAQRDWNGYVTVSHTNGTDIGGG